MTGENAPLSTVVVEMQVADRWKSKVWGNEKKYVVWGPVFVSLVFVSLFVWAVHIWANSRPGGCSWNMDFMCLEEVCKIWGDHPLNVEEFRTNEENRYLRARMACSLLKNQKQYVGMEVSEIEEKFGFPAGYYLSESHPAYLIGEVEERGGVWQIVFLSTNGRIDEIVVHRNCC